MSAADKLAQVLAEHGEMLQFHAGNGSIEPREAWAECNCGEHLWDWQEYYNEAPDEPEDAFRAHQSAVVLAHLTAEGWAQGREEWGYGATGGYDGTYVRQTSNEAEARDRAQINDCGVFRRRVTDWEPADA